VSASVHPFAGAAPPPTLAREIDAINRQLAAIAGCAEPEPMPPEATPPWALDMLTLRFSLSAGERGALLFAAASECCGETAALVARIGSGPPTLGLAMRVCEGLGWADLRPDAALRRARLIALAEVPGTGLSERPFRIDDNVLLFLNGCTQIAPELIAVSQSLSGGVQLAADQALVTAIAEVCEAARGAPLAMPVIELRSSERADGVAHALAGFQAAGFGSLVIPLSRLPADPEALVSLRDLWLRDALLYGLALVLVDDLSGAGMLDPLVGGWAGPVALVADAARLELTARRSFAIGHDRAQQRAAWQSALGQTGAGAVTDDLVERMAHAFHLAAPVVADLAQSHGSGPPEALWAAARAAACPRDIGFVDRIVPVAQADQLILPDDAATTIATIIGAGRAHHRVVGEWGFGSTAARGLGITALFAGESGTGKTMAAEAIAQALALDLYRVEVSAVVSKYIGETEKNLRRVFAAAEAGGGVLLFDEADTLFGKRSEVKDAHDRYANMEVGYLLQLMESFAGITILTTNIDDGLDSAFMRRLRFVVQFPLPGQAERERIWAGIFPAATPRGDIDFAALARLSLTGGNIRNIALGASLRAAAADRVVGMAEILEAARAELVKLGRPLSDIDQRSWG
jgi:hypothetical protein